MPLSFPDHVSHSMLNALNKCKRMWFHKYMLREPEKKSSFQLLGLTVHHIIDQVARGVIPEDLPTILKRYESAFNNLEVWREVDGKTIELEDINWGGTSDRVIQSNINRTFYDGSNLLRTFYDGNVHRINRPYLLDYETHEDPTCTAREPASEIQLTIPLEKYGGRRLKYLDARLDVITHDLKIIDYKTKYFKEITQAEFERDLQPLIYAWACTQAGFLIPPVEFRYGQLVYGKEYYYTQAIGGKIPGWKIEAFDQLVLPGLVRDAEKTIDEVLDSPEHLQEAYFEGSLRPGPYCGTCDWKSTCPLFDRTGLVRRVLQELPGGE